ncbi:MAG: sialate O-acetylesterase [Paludibacter sp.]
MKKRIYIFFILLSTVCQIDAEISLPVIIADNMVLQQQTGVKLWGNACADKKVSVRTLWNGKLYSVISNSVGNWILTVKTPTVGGPYSITFSDGKEKTISNVMIGEVWFCSGQSNMEMPMKGYAGQPVTAAQNAIAKADPSAPIRLFKVEKNKSITPLQDVTGTWNENTPQAVKEFSATAYFYALYLQSVLKVPVGIITAAWGGAGIESFMDSVTLSEFQKVNTPAKNTDKLTSPKHCELYNGMIYPLQNFAIKGVLWYQGEANAASYKLYKKQFPAMVAQWRKCWGQGNFPFYFAQIAPWKYSGVQRTEAARQREVQQNCMDIIPNSGMVVTVDTGDSIVIHPPMKQMIAERFAYWALNKTYGRERIECRAPEYNSMTISNDTIVLDFKFAEDGLHSITKQIQGFEIAGRDSIFKPAQVMLTNKSKKIKLTEATISNPVAARYAFKNYSSVSLFSNLGFPLTPFRTDDW